MHIHVVMSHIHNAAGDIGTVVADALQGSQQIRPDKSGFDGAASLLQTQNVMDAEFRMMQLIMLH